MNRIVAGAVALHQSIFGTVKSLLDGWFLGLLARFCFAAVLCVYFLDSAGTKIGDGPLGFLSVSDNAYYQIMLPVVEAHGGDVSKVAIVPWGLTVWAGTHAELLLPLMIVAGLFTRVAAVGMAVFIAAQTYVDIAVHHVGAETIGLWFDRFPDAAIADQRLLWIFPLAYLVLNGAGLVSVDAFLERLWHGRRVGRAGIADERPLP